MRPQNHNYIRFAVRVSVDHIISLSGIICQFGDNFIHLSLWAQRKVIPISDDLHEGKHGDYEAAHFPWSFVQFRGIS